MSNFKVDTVPAGLPIGTILYYAAPNTTNLPSDWKVCDGTYLSQTEYPELFALLQWQYSSFNSNTQFALPSMVGVRVRGASSFASAALSIAVGSGTVNISNASLPQHSHGATNWYHNHSSNDNYKFHDANGTGYLRYVTKGNSGHDDSNHQLIFYETDYSTKGGSANSVGSYFTASTGYAGAGGDLTLNPAFINFYAIIKVL